MMNEYYEKGSCPPDYCASCGHSLRPSPKRKTNFLFFFILSVCVPGANFMYMGLMKRGLFILSAFFLAVYATSIISAMPFAFLIAIICIAAFFDGFATRRRIISGENVEDSVADITGFISRYKVPIFGFLSLTVILSILSRVFQRLNSYFGYPLRHSDLPMVILSIVLVLGGIYFMTRSKKSEPIIDKRINN